MAIEKLDLIKNPETAPFSKLKYLKWTPEDEVTEFFNRLFHLNVAAREAGDWSDVDRFLEEQGDSIAAKVAAPWHLTTRLGPLSRSGCPSRKSRS